MALALLWPLLTIAAQERRVALVVGNSAYQSGGEVPEAAEDASAMAEALEGIGFEVTLRTDLDGKAFRAAVSDLAASARGAEAVMLYFSGRAFQLGGRNYLVPVDARLGSKDAVGKEALRLDEVIDRIEARDRQALVFVDAARGNPLPEAVRGKNAAEGLARMDAGNGNFVAFAAQPGSVAAEVDGAQDAFTQALLEHLPTPGISISDMMIRVRNGVEEATGQAQTPWDQASLRSQFYFRPQEEKSAALTDEDRDLLLSLDPALRKKFEAKFGIKVDPEAGAEGGPPATLQIPTIRRKLRITGVGAPDAGGEGGAAAPAEVARAEPQPVRRTLRIVPEDFAPPEAAAPAPETETARPAEPAVETPPPAAAEQAAKEVAEAKAPEPVEPAAAEPAVPATVPIPTARPAIETAAAEAAPAQEVAEAAPAQEVAALAPAEIPGLAVQGAAGARLASAPPPELAGRVGAAGEAMRLRPSVEGTAPASAAGAASPVEVASAGETAPRAALPESLSGLSAAVPADSVRPGALRPVAPAVERIAGQEVVEEPAPEAEAVAPALPETAPPPAAAPAAEQAEVTVAALGTPERAPGELVRPEVRPEAVAPEAKAAVPVPPAEEEEPASADEAVLARAVQTELARLGCYRSGIDGEWGPGSARALLRYYATKKEDPDDLDLNAALLAKLTREDTVVCKQTETAPPRQRTVRVRERAPEVSQGSRAAPSAPAARAPATRQAENGGDSGGKKKLNKSLSIGGFR